MHTSKTPPPGKKIKKLRNIYRFKKEKYVESLIEKCKECLN